MATNSWYDWRTYENEIKPAIEKLNSGDMNLDIYHNGLGDIPLYQQDGQYTDGPRQNFSNIKNWVNENITNVGWMGSDGIIIKEDKFAEFNSQFQQNLIVQIPSNAKGGNLHPDSVISYTNMAKDAGTLQVKRELTIGALKKFETDWGEASSDGTMEWKEGTSAFVMNSYERLVELEKQYREDFDALRERIDSVQTVSHQSTLNGEPEIYNSTVTLHPDGNKENVSIDTMIGAIQSSAIWDKFPATLNDQSILELANDMKTEAENIAEMLKYDPAALDAAISRGEITREEVGQAVAESLGPAGGPPSIQDAIDVDLVRNNPDFFMTPPGQPRPNTLHFFSSFTTNFELFMLTPHDFNEISRSLMAEEYDRSEYKKIETKPGRRLMGSSGVARFGTDGGLQNPYFRREYHIDDLTLESYVSPSKTNGGTKFTNGTFTVYEAYGATLLENLVKASILDPINSHNYIEIPYLLKISFMGYDADGNKITSGQYGDDENWTKYLTIKLSNFQFKVTDQGSEYEIGFFNYDADAIDNYYGSLEKNVQVNGGTLDSFFNLDNLDGLGPYAGGGTLAVGEMDTKEHTFEYRNSPRGGMQEPGEIQTATRPVDFFRIDGTARSLPQILSRQQQEKVKNNEQDHADIFRFVFDPGQFQGEESAFRNAKLAKPNKTDSKGVPVQTDRIKALTQNRLITTTFATNPSTNDELAYQFPKGASILNVIHTAIATSTFMTNQVRITTTEVDLDPGLKRAMYGNPGARVYKNDYELSGTKESPLLMYKVTPRIILGEWDTKRKTYQKTINYILSIYNREGQSATNVARSAVDNVVKRYDYLYSGKNQDVLEFEMNMNTSYFNKKITGDFSSQVANAVNRDNEARSITPQGPVDMDLWHPQRTKIISNDASHSTQGDSKDPATMIITDLMSSIYQQGADQLAVEMKIMGDPAFIVQDENFGNKAHSSHFTPTGSVSTHKDPIVEVFFKTPNDLPQPGVTDTSGNTTSVFSGRYRVLTITSSISSNEFTQELMMMKIKDEDKDNVITQNPTATNKVIYTTYTDENGNVMMKPDRVGLHNVGGGQTS